MEPEKPVADELTEVEPVKEQAIEEIIAPPSIVDQLFLMIGKAKMQFIGRGSTPKHFQITGTRDCIESFKQDVMHYTMEHDMYDEEQSVEEDVLSCGNITLFFATADKLPFSGANIMVSIILPI